MAANKTGVTQMTADTMGVAHFKPEVEPEVVDVFDTILTHDEYYHRNRFEDIVLSLIHGIALASPERRRTIIKDAIALARLVESELDSAQS